MKKTINFKLIEEFRIREGLSIAKFCQLSNISYSTYKTISKGSLHIKLTYFFKIAKYMKVKIEDLLK